MPAYVIFDVDIRDGEKSRAFATGVKPARQAIGATPVRRDACSAGRLPAVDGA